MPITFHKEEIEFDLPDNNRLADWLHLIAYKNGKILDKVAYIFCSDEYLLEINKTYLDHDYYTDIITFPYRQGKEIESDIFISVDRVIDNSKEFNSTFNEELLRVIAHGILHLIGFRDKTDEDQIEMTKMENECLEKWKELNS